MGSLCSAARTCSPEGRAARQHQPTVLDARVGQLPGMRWWLVAVGCGRVRKEPGRKESGSLARLGDAIRSGIPKTHTHTHTHTHTPTPTHTHCPRRSKLHRTDPRLEALTLLVAPGRPSSVPFLTTIAPLAGPTAVRLHPGSRRDPRGHRHPVDPLRYPGRHRTWRRHRARLRRRRRGALVLDPFLLHTDRR